MDGRSCFITPANRKDRKVLPVSPLPVMHLWAFFFALLAALSVSCPLILLFSCRPTQTQPVETSFQTLTKPKTHNAHRAIHPVTRLSVGTFCFFHVIIPPLPQHVASLVFVRPHGENSAKKTVKKLKGRSMKVAIRSIHAPMGFVVQVRWAAAIVTSSRTAAALITALRMATAMQTRKGWRER